MQIVGQYGLFNLGKITNQEKENSKFKPAVLSWKIDLVSYPTHGRKVDLIHL